MLKTHNRFKRTVIIITNACILRLNRQTDRQRETEADIETERERGTRGGRGGEREREKDEIENKLFF